MKLRSDLADGRSLPGIEVFQITDETIPSSHIYMEAQVFTPDSKRFVLHRSAHAHGHKRGDPEHRYLLCDIEDRCRLEPLTDETVVTGAVLSPDGRFFYYFVDETVPGGGRLTLKRLDLNDRRRETVTVLDSPLPGTRFCPSRISTHPTVSSDGARLALSAFLGDGQQPDPHWGLIVFDLRGGLAKLIFHGSDWGNMHAQYCRSTDAVKSHDILVQNDHGNRYAPDGTTLNRHAAQFDPSPELNRLALARRYAADRNFSGLGTDVHVVRDDGTQWRTMPWGRDGNEQCQGHECWRGDSDWAITSTVVTEPEGYTLVESQALASNGHLGLRTPGGARNVLSRNQPAPLYYHFATDIAGRRIISDAIRPGSSPLLYLGALGEPGRAAAAFTFLLDTRASGSKEAQSHPFLSPDGTMAFFNSDESGVLQAYMVRGLCD